MKGKTFIGKAKTQGNQAIKLNALRRVPESTLNATVKIEGITSPIIKCTAKVDFVKAGVRVQAGQVFYLVASSTFAARYYVVAWNEMRTSWQCSCGADCRQHSHVTTVKSYIVDHVVRPKLAETVPADPVAEKLAEVRAAASYVNDAPHPQTAEEWKVALAKQKAGDRAYRQAILTAAQSLRNSA